jgi:predicted acyltransferase
MVAGLMWNWSFPINKNLWTSSYVVFTAGMGAVVLGVCIWIIDELGVKWWTKPFLILGRNPLLAFLGSGAMARLIYSVITVPSGGESVPVQRVIYERFYASWLEPRNASLLFAVSFVLVWIAALGVLHRKRVILKV